jgi:PAS domain S-box-containing protein
MDHQGDFQLIPADWVADPLQWVDEDGRILHANEAGCRALGYTLDELTALFVWDVDVNLSPERWLIRDEAAFVAGDLKSILRRKDGSTFPVEVRGRIVRMNGRRHYVATLRDISAYLKLEKEARDAERNNRAMLDNIPDIAWMKDTESRFIAINQAAADLFHIAAADAVGKTDYDLVPAELAARYRADDAAVIASGERKCVEEPLIGADGAPRWIETIKTPIRDSDGSIVGTVGIARDISARKIAEMGEREMRDMLESLVNDRTCALRAEITAREAADAALVEKQLLLETILDAATAVIFVKNLDGRYMLVNQQYLSLGNWRRDDVIGKSDFDLYPPALAQHLCDNDRYVRESAVPVEFEETIESLEGVRTFIALKVPLMTSGGEVFAVCGIATDITERKEAQALLLQAKDAAEQGNRAKSDFLCVMSHELRTPLNAVLGFSEVLLLEYFGGLNAKQRDYVQSISHSGGHLLHIINDILDYAQIDAGRMVLYEVAIDVGQLLQDCLDLVDTSGRRVGIDIATPFPAMRADELRLRQILVNLIGNAVKFSSSGASVALAAALRDDGGITISVRDTGIGMRPEDIPRVLEMFTQLDTPFNRQHAGTGVGLPLAASLAKAHGATMEIDSAPGQGTTVRLQLPPERTVVQP